MDRQNRKQMRALFRGSRLEIIVWEPSYSDDESEDNDCSEDDSQIEEADSQSEGQHYSDSDEAQQAEAEQASWLTMSDNTASNDKNKPADLAVRDRTVSSITDKKSIDPVIKQADLPKQISFTDAPKEPMFKPPSTNLFA